MNPGIHLRDVVGAARLQEDGVPGITKARHQRNDVLLQERLAPRNFHQAAAELCHHIDDFVQRHLSPLIKRVFRVAIIAAQIAKGQPDEHTPTTGEGALALDRLIDLINGQCFLWLFHWGLDVGRRACIAIAKHCGQVQRWTLKLTVENRIDNLFAKLRAQNRKAFIPYICAGDPDLEYTVSLAVALEASGADILELGLPFSDPLADGVVNQQAAQRALRAGATTRAVLQCVEATRAQSSIPIVLYSYLNPILQFGWEKFHERATAAGVDGLLILDLPPEEDFAPDKVDCLKRSSLTARPVESGLHQEPIHVRLIAPTTPPWRIDAIARQARGFLYYVSREGVTGSRANISSSLAEQIAQIRKHSDLPIAVGFGISNPQQAKQVAQHADAVVIGSAIVDLIAKHRRGSVEPVSAFARQIAEAIR